MRERVGVRVIAIAPDGRFPLFHFAYHDGPLAGSDYWGLPGGGVEAGETLAEAAVREFREETGLAIAQPSASIGESMYPFRLSSGEDVAQHDHYFAVQFADRPVFSRDRLTPEERDSLEETRWWSLEQLEISRERILPPDLSKLLHGFRELRNLLKRAR